jgi:hypothetical protein
MFCMAVWLAGTIFIAVVATQNFYTIDRLLTDSPNGVFRHAVDAMTETPTVRELLRYLSSELNRLYFQYWNLVQLPLGILTLWLVSKLPNSRYATWQIVAMLGVVLFLMLVVTPEILSIGRSLDFLPRDPVPAGMRTFALLHTAYAVFTLINIVLGVLVTLWIQKSTPSQEE